MAFARGGRMNEEAGTVLGLVFIFTIIVGLGFALGRAIKTDDTIREINQKICKQLYQQNTNKYINCSTKDINENIELIKDITNDR
jgi:hypothetical protein